MSKYGVISGPHFPAYGPQITQDLETFHAVYFEATIESETENPVRNAIN